ncbi:hypothetical protein QAD02_019775 [Eretmocerus hayati]|uniref:Uncharacterized protein n=1 Tax=Eretmocerus hayati TaxID=131215 RepID=A0ACC2PLQ4_9HYME|nr:hypothetical protein QAD02_019775 [Eretmocerus hayati]
MELISSVLIFLLGFTPCHPLDFKESHESITKKWRINDQYTVHRAKKISRDDTQLYATCERNRFERYCNMTIRPLIESLPHANCNMKFSVHGDKNLMSFERYMELESFINPYNIIVTWAEYDSERMRILKNIAVMNITNRYKTCVAKYLSFSSPGLMSEEPSTRTHVLIYDNAFDVITSDSEKCGTLKYCRIGFNERGEVIQPLVPVTTNLIGVSKMFPVSSMNFSDGMFSLAIPNENFQLGYRTHYENSSGGEIQLNTTIQSYMMKSDPLLSTANQKYTICGSSHIMNAAKEYQAGTLLVHCNYYSLGHVMPEFEKVVNYPEIVRVVSVLNLRRGGFLLLTLKCQRTFLRTKCDSFSFTEIRLNKPELRSDDFVLDLQSVEKITDWTVDIKEKIKDNVTKFCFYFSCLSKSLQDLEKSHLKFYKRCVERV